MDTLKIKFNDDGTVSIDATGMKGTASAIEAQLKSLAASVGGDLKIERHVHGAHTHQHEKGGTHVQH
jgi:hypothetical protein